MSKKRNDKESMICLTPKPNQSFFVCRTHSKEKKFLRNRNFLRKRESGGLTKKRKKGFFKLLSVRRLRRTLERQ